MTSRRPSPIRLVALAVASLLVPAAAAMADPAQFVIVNINAAGVGFNDPTPAAPVGGNTGTTLGEQRLIAFSHAAGLWSARLDSAVPIRIRAQFTPLAANVLGSAGPIQVFRDFPHAPLTGRGTTSRLPTSSPAKISRPRSDDINANFSSTFNFYLGLDDNHGGARTIWWPSCCTSSRTDWASARSQASSTGAYFSGFPDVYNTNLLDTDGRPPLVADDQCAARSRRPPTGAAWSGTAAS